MEAELDEVVVEFSSEPAVPFETVETLEIPIEFSEVPLNVGPASVPEMRHFPSEVMQLIHAELLDSIIPERLDKPRSEDKEELRRKIFEIVARNRLPFSGVERDQLAEQMLYEVYAYGPLQPLLEDDTVDDILVNGHKTVYVERSGKLEETTVRFRDDAHLMTIVDRIVSEVGRRVDESSPTVDARLPNGSRVNITLPPAAIDGPHICIRKFGKHPLTVEDLLRNKTLTPEMLEFLAGAVKARLCCLISGGTGAGKTTLLNALSRYIGSRERIVTIEDSAELILQQKHVIRLECRPPNIEGKGEIKQRHLLINALRMRPDRIVLGEVRGDEAVDLLEALNTGHEGSLATIHANTPREALTRLEGLVLRGAANLPDKVIKLQIASAVSIIIQVTRTSDGKRRVTSITEVCSMQQDVITSQEIFTFDRTGVDQKGQTHGVFRGVMTPSCLDSIGSAGVHLNSALFQNRMEV